MSNERVITDRRLLAALDYIDQKYIDDVFSIIKEPDIAVEYVPGKKSPFKYWKQFVALAACLILLSVAAPLAGYISQVISNFRAGAGSETMDSTTQIIEETSPFFWMYTPDLEPVTKEQVDECNRVFRLYCCGTLEEFIATYPEDRKESAKKVYEEVVFFTTNKSRAYLGTFNGAILSAGFIDNHEEHAIVLGDNVIGFGAGISVYKDGEIYSIVEAYENGWITDDNVKTIIKRLKIYKNTLYRGK